MAISWHAHPPLSPHPSGPACEELTRIMEGDLLSSMLWKRLKPLVLGKVLFTPDTAFTRKLMAQVGEAWSDGGNERER